MSRTALVIVESAIHRDPRVLRQIDWLLADGWTVDSLGLGARPERRVRDHFELGSPPEWTRTRLGTVVLYLLSSHRRRFRILGSDHMGSTARDRIRSGSYDLIVFNDIHLLPWVKDPALFTEKARRSHLHVDVHEYFPAEIPRTSLWNRATARSWAWRRRLIGDPAFRSRSTVVAAIGDLYAKELGIDKLTIVRNAPPYEELAPRPVSDDRIRLVYHGKADWNRGLDILVDAMSKLDERFELTFMLVGGDAVKGELERRSHSIADRVHFRSPVPTDQISRAINQYDLEVMFFPPTTVNLRYALPNKLFEAIQGRLGIVVGATEPMVEIVDAYRNGVVVSGGWSADDLAEVLSNLDRESIDSMKRASDAAAAHLNSGSEGGRFIQVVRGGSPRP